MYWDCQLNFNRVQLVVIIIVKLTILGNWKLLIGYPFTGNRDISPESHWLEDPGTPPLIMLKELLKNERMAENGFEYRIVREVLNIPWVLSVSDNQMALFKTQMILTEKTGGGSLL